MGTKSFYTITWMAGKISHMAVKIVLLICCVHIHDEKTKFVCETKGKRVQSLETIY